MNETTTTTYNHIEQVDWILPVITNIFLTVFSLWMLLSLLHYGIKTGKWRKTNSSKYELLNAGIVFACGVFLVGLSLLRYAMSLASMNLGFYEDQQGLCHAIGSLAYAIYIIFLYFYEVFLWLRQRIFYNNKILNVSYNIYTKILSFISIFLITVIWLAVAVYNTISLNYMSNDEGCASVPDRDNDFVLGGFVIGALCSAHFILLGLYLYALLRIKASSPSVTAGNQQFDFSGDCGTNINSTLPSEPNSSTLTSKSAHSGTLSFFTSFTLQLRSQQDTSTRIRVILLKTFALGLLSIICNTLLNAFGHFIVNPFTDQRWSQMAFDTNTFLTLVFLLFSFDAYKQMLFSPCFTKHSITVEARIQNPNPF